MDTTNHVILQQLREYAQKYFAAIIEVNTIGGKCIFKPGEYTAKDVAKRDYKAPLGRYTVPEDEEYDEDITVFAGAFKCKLPYRRIFDVLADWENLCKVGQKKTIFKVGNAECKTVKVLVNETTALGAYKTKSMKLQRIGGNWWGQPKEIQQSKPVIGYYELNGVMFAPGKTFWGGIGNESDMIFAEKYNDAEIIRILISFLLEDPEGEKTPYFAEVARLAGIDIESEEAKAIAEAAKEEERKREEERQREEAEERERKRIREEEYRKRIEEEERRAAESLVKAKENFIAGKAVSRSDFERIADSVSYAINIRTLGTLRKRITWIEVANDGTPTVYGTKKRAGLDGTFAAIREVYELVKAHDEEGSEPIKHISEIMETCRTWDDEKRGYTDEYKYYTWLANHIPEHKATNKNTTELILEEVRERISAAATLAAHGVPKCDIEGAVCAVVNRLAKMEDILQFYNRAEPPQPPESASISNSITPRPNRAHRPLEIANRSVCNRAFSIVAMRQRGVEAYPSLTARENVCCLILTTPGYVWPIRGS